MNTIDVTILIKEIYNQLHEAYEDPILSQQYAWWILESITKKNKTQLIAQETIMLSPVQQEEIKQWLNKLVIKHMPIQYLIGSVPFNDIEILIQPPILIPRPETEEWCLTLIDQFKQLENQKITILDLATGSGCIALALAKHLPQAQIYASDISKEALDLAQQNAEHNKLSNVMFIHSDLFISMPHGMQFDIIVSNPPYIAPEEWNQLEPSVTKWEDPQALIAQEHGFAIIKQIITTSPTFVKPNEKMKQQYIPQVVIEIGHKQGEQAISLMKTVGYNAIMVHKDLAGKDRSVSGRVDHVATTAT